MDVWLCKPSVPDVHQFLGIAVLALESGIALAAAVMTDLHHATHAHQLTCQACPLSMQGCHVQYLCLLSNTACYFESGGCDGSHGSGDDCTVVPGLAELAS
jgi:hypothetical protein